MCAVHTCICIPCVLRCTVCACVLCICEYMYVCMCAVCAVPVCMCAYVYMCLCACVLVYHISLEDTSLSDIGQGYLQPSIALLSVHALWGGGLVEIGNLSGILHYR